MSQERIPPGMEPISEPPDKQQFLYDTQQTAKLLGVPESQVIKLARSGRLLFRYTDDRYRCRQCDIDSFRREQQKNTRRPH
jgi:hypothetical protein